MSPSGANVVPFVACCDVDVFDVVVGVVIDADGALAFYFVFWSSISKLKRSQH